MPTRSGLDFHAINPDFFVCAYCYQAERVFGRFAGMVPKRVRLDIDGDWVALPDQWTAVWTEPHCFPCHRKIQGYKLYCTYPNKYKYE